MSTETSTQRPWAAVAPWPEDRFLPKVGAHYTAMAWAHMLAYRAALVAAVKLDSEDQIQDAVRHRKRLPGWHTTGEAPARRFAHAARMFTGLEPTGADPTKAAPVAVLRRGRRTRGNLA